MQTHTYTHTHTHTHTQIKASKLITFHCGLSWDNYRKTMACKYSALTTTCLLIFFCSVRVQSCFRCEFLSFVAFTATTRPRMGRYYADCSKVIFGGYEFDRLPRFDDVQSSGMMWHPGLFSCSMCVQSCFRLEFLSLVALTATTRARGVAIMMIY